MQLGDQYIPQAAKYDHVFSKYQKKNRVELVTDFPEQNDAEMIMALQIHPQCRCMLTRNVSCDEQSEWTCIHDINEEPELIDDDSNDEDEPLTKKKRTLLPQSSETEQEEPAQRGVQTRSQVRRIFYPRRVNGTMSLVSARSDSFIPDIWAAEVTVQERAIRQSRARNSANHVSGYNFVYAISSGVLPLRYSSASRLLSGAARTRVALGGDQSTQTTDSAAAATETTGSRSSSTSSSSSSSSGSSSASASGSGNSNNDNVGPELGAGLRMRPLSNISAAAVATASENAAHTILVNAKKLLYYASETNNKPGFIKEPGFSADGRIICSPYANGVRLLGYQADCSDYPSQIMLEQVKHSPRQLVELANIIEHQDVVLCAKFSPREPLLVTGCNSGEVAWYRPCL